MYLLEVLKKIVSDKEIDSLAIFVDMDGVIADYRFGEGENIRNNVPGTYLKKRPIYTAINNLKEINAEEKFEIYILSSCFFREQAEEKNEWLDKYANFIKQENRIFTYNESFESRKDAKIRVIKEKLKSNKYEYAVLIDDTHDILFKGIKEIGDKFLPFHVSTLID